MLHRKSLNPLNKPTTKKGTTRQPLFVMLLAIVALGGVLFSVSSIAVVHSSDAITNMKSAPAPGAPSSAATERGATASLRTPEQRGQETVLNHAMPKSRLFSSLALPSLTATKRDTLTGDVNSDGIANPGDTLTYTVTITNSGSTDATGVVFSDTPDANTTLVPGSITATPIAIDDTYTATGNVRISVPAPGLLGNDEDPEGDAVTASDGATSANGGNVSVSPDGSFTYNPPPGFTGVDSFNYTITDSHGNANTGTVTITVNDMIWFVNSAAAPGGDGRLTSPYNCLKGAGCFDSAAPDDPGDNIFLYSGSYTGGITLLANQKLIGQGATNSLAVIAGITLAPNSDPLPSTGGADPVITTTLAATIGVTVGTNNLLRGFTIGNTTGAGLVGNAFGTLTVREVTVNGQGQALNLSGGTLDASFPTLESLNSTGQGITLSGVSGSLTTSTTNIQSSSGIGISVATLGAGVLGVDFGNTTVNGSNNTGVSLTNNTGNITFAKLDISPLNAKSGLVISNSVAVASPGTIKTTSGTISTTNAIAVSIAGASAALRTPLNITLDKVSDVNTAAIAAGISVSNTTVPVGGGGFTVLGTGGTSGDGGTIQLAQQGAVFLAADSITLKYMKFINANTLDGGLTCSSTNVTNCKGAINLNTTSGVTIDNLFMDRTVATAGTEYGIFGRSVTNLTINASTIQNQGDQNNEGVMRFSNLLGTSAFTNSTFKFASFKDVDIQNDTGSLSLTVTGSTFSDTQTSATGADGLSIRTTTSASATAAITNSNFLRLRTVGVSGASLGTSNLTVNVTGSSFDPVAPGIGRAVDLSSQNTSTLNFNVNNNPKIYSNGGPAINIFAVDSSLLQGRVNNNPDIKLGGAGTPGSGVNAQLQNNATQAIEVSGNTFTGLGNDSGIRAISSQNSGGGGGRLDATITNNSVTVAGTGAGIDIEAGTSATDVNQLCGNVRTNTVSGAPAGKAFLEGTFAAGASVFMDGFVVSATATWAANGNTPPSSVTESNAGTVGPGTCTLPSNPSARLNDPMKPASTLAKDTHATPLKPGGRAQEIRMPELAQARTATVATAAPRQNTRNRSAHARSESGASTAMMSHAVRTRPMLLKPSMVAGGVNLNIGTIPAGESITITFRVTINNPLSPTNTTQVANQGTVSGSNFGSIVTDDPDTGALNDPTVTPVVNPNNAPDAVNDTATVAEDSGANSINVLANDTDPDGNTLTITAVTQGANGSVAITGGGTGLTYTPNANYNGSDSFTYTISDGNGGTDTATVNVTVTEVNDAPTAVDDALSSIAEDSGPRTIPFATLTGNDSAGPANESGQSLTITAVGNAVGGTVNISGTDVIFTPTANYNGPASFDYTVQDNGTTNGVADPKTDIGSVSFTITSVNDNPTANDDSATVAEDSGANTINVLANDSFAPDTGETLTITAVTQGANGSVAITGGGTTVSYTPNANYNGADSFTYTISDGNGGTDTATVSITVTSVNDPPDAVNDSATVAEDSGANSINVLANDSISPDTGETLTITSVTQGANGSVAITGGGTGLTYTPNANYNGPDSFTYTISDGNGGSDSATVSMTVTSVNDPPDAVNDSATVAEDSGANTINVLANDTTAPDAGETLTITAKTDGANGSVAITGGGTAVTYTPNANFFGSDSFTYTISDGNGGTDTATVSVTVTNVNDPPDAVNDSATVAEDSGANTINVLANDTFAPDAGETLTIVSVTQGTNGSVAITGGGTTVSYTPNANYFGSDSFTYTISDGNGGTDTATVSITVTAVNDAPFANAGPDQTVSCTGTVVLDGTASSDVDDASNTLTYTWKEGSTVIATGAHPTVTLGVGVHTITLTVTDPHTAASQDTVTITVIDDSLPVITLTGQTIVLEPSNHQYETINLNSLVSSASDACDPTVDLSDVVIAQVTSDEAENGNDDGNTSNDIVIAPDCKSVQLRAERSGTGNGRVYTITFLVRDTTGNTTTATAKVTVPKSHNGVAAVDDGPHYTVTSSCQ